MRFGPMILAPRCMIGWHSWAMKASLWKPSISSPRGTAPRRAQDETLVTKSSKINKEDGRLDWTLPAAVLERRIRAFNPWPGAYTFVDELLLKVWKVELVAVSSGAPGTLRDGVIAAGEGGLRLTEVQPAGGKRMSFDAFQRGHKLENGLLLK